MSIVETAALAVGGLALGSFLNLTIDWLPRRESSPGPVAEGATPQRPLTLMGLVPVAGYLWSRRRYPGPIPARLPAVEAITATLCGLVAYRYGLTPETAVLVFYCALLIHLAFVDLEHFLILNVVVLSALPLCLVIFPFSPLGQEWGLGEALWRSLAGVGLGLGIMLLIYGVSRGRMGVGDVKLGALLGAMLGFPQIVVGLFLAFIFGGIVGVTLLALKLKRRTDPVPYGPILVAGAAVILLSGTDIYDWYLDLFR